MTRLTQCANRPLKTDSMTKTHGKKNVILTAKKHILTAKDA